jgi:hypothetical protein
MTPETKTASTSPRRQRKSNGDEDKTEDLERPLHKRKCKD